ncbi:hypothetical protein [Terasakiella pusilla]|uniref:PDC sensor domain-containing protein n=1 Tax=Terasakiella pusilla TaxID=64973 RepID=UPI003AA84CE0
MRALYLFICAVILTTNAHASDELTTYANLQKSHVQDNISAIKGAIQKANGLLRDAQARDEKDVHDDLQQIVQNTAGLRAIIYIDKDGILTVDSFTYPARRINLTDREYVKAVADASHTDLYIGQPVQGRSSGVSFIPLSQRVTGENGEPLGVVAGIVTPDALIRQDILCTHCFMGIFSTGGTKLVSYPSSTRYGPTFLAEAAPHANGAAFKHQFGNQSVVSMYKTIDGFDLHIIMSHLVSD